MISLPTSPPFLYVSGVCQYIQFEEWSYLSTLEIKEKLIRELGQRKEGADQVARENGNGGGHPSVRPAPVRTEIQAGCSRFKGKRKKRLA